MLVATPTEIRTATTTTPTPIGCKLLKINRLAVRSAVCVTCCVSRRCAFYRTQRMRQHLISKWLRGQDLNLRPSGYEPDELPDCSTPRLSQMKLRQSRSGTIAKRACRRQHLKRQSNNRWPPAIKISSFFKRLGADFRSTAAAAHARTSRSARGLCLLIAQAACRHTRYH